MRNETKKVLDELHVKMKKIDDPVVNMSGGQRQGIAIGRAIYFNARVLIMDEPTAALGPEESRMVGQLIKRLKTQGVGIILISHDINDVFDLSDRLTIMAGERVVDTLLTKDTDEDEVLGYDHHWQIKTHWWSEGRDGLDNLRIPRENQMLCAQRLVGWRF